MTLDADSVIESHAIENAIKYFEDPEVVGVAANVKIRHSYRPIGLLQMFEHMVGYRSKKFYTMINSEIIVGGVASIYRFELMKRLGWYDDDTQTEDIGLSLKIASAGNKENRLVYASNVVAMTEGVQTLGLLFKQRYRWKLGMIQNLIKHKYLFGNTANKFSFLLAFYRVPMAFLGEIILLFEPILFGYVLYLSITYNEMGFFMGAYATIVVYLLFTVWHDEHIDIPRRIMLSMYMPMMYFVFYLMNLVQLVAVVRCFIKPKEVLRKKAVSGSWVSPRRTQLSTTP